MKEPSVWRSQMSTSKSILITVLCLLMTASLARAGGLEEFCKSRLEQYLPVCKGTPALCQDSGEYRYRACLSNGCWVWDRAGLSCYRARGQQSKPKIRGNIGGLIPCSE